jgi:hypothetical protein
MIEFDFDGFLLILTKKDSNIVCVWHAVKKKTSEIFFINQAVCSFMHT